MVTHVCVQHQTRRTVSHSNCTGRPGPPPIAPAAGTPTSTDVDAPTAVTLRAHLPCSPVIGEKTPRARFLAAPPPAAWQRSSKIFSPSHPEGTPTAGCQCGRVPNDGLV